jgi:hypothetical protein
MNDDLLKISLNQGKQFNTYQTKIKKSNKKYNKQTKKEGFVTINKEQEQMVRPKDEGYSSVLQNYQQGSTLTNNTNQKDLDELTQLQTKYDSLIQQYTDIQTKIGDSSLNTINRVSKNNPYLNKTVKFTTGHICYVTNQGVVKYIPSPEILDSVNIPKNIINITIPWDSAYNVPGTKIPTIPPLISGTNVKKGQTLGNEGSNVYASKLINNPSSTYIGCYNDNNGLENDQRAMIMNSNTIEYTTFDKCQEYAVENGYQYFGMQDYKSDRTAACVVSNDLEKTKMYGDGTIQRTLIQIWSSNTAGSGATSCYLNSDGRLLINNASGSVIWESPNSPSDCWWSGYVNPDSIQGSFGGNCVGKQLNVDCGNPNPNQSYGTTGIVGNLNTILKNKATNTLKYSQNPQVNWSFNPLTEWNGGDPAFCCAKLVDYSYQCGGGPFKSGQISGGSNINFDCSNEVNNCSFFLLLQSDGNVSLNRGTNPSNNKGNIWSTMTNGKQKSPNPDWILTKGKFGRNYLKINEFLGGGEWIGSDDGSIKLIMQTDGNLVLYTSEVKPGCKLVNNKNYGEQFVNAVYKLSGAGDKSVLGKISYIDSDSLLKKYPDSMIGYTNNYQVYQNSDSAGNDLTNLIAPTQDGCQTACNNNIACAAYVYQSSSQTCWLKNKSAYPRGDKQQVNNLILGIRKPGLKGSTTCSNKIADVDTIQYNNYLKGSEMTKDTQCNVSVVSQEDQIKYDNIKSQLVTLGNDIASKMENLYNEDNRIFEKLNINAEQFKTDLEKYKQTNFKILQNSQNLQSNDIEGMQNIVMDDLNGMVSDTDLRVLQENYSYIMWSILAVGLLTVTINTMRK